MMPSPHADPEVEQADAVAGLDHDVGGLDVAVDELAAKLAVENEVDGSHAAMTELADDLEAALDDAVREPWRW